MMNHTASVIDSPEFRIAPYVERCGEALPYDMLVSAWRAVSRTHGFTLEEFVIGTPARRLLCARIGTGRPHQIMISAGVHGDEPVTPWALLDLVRRGQLDAQYGYTLWCCVNPTGYEDGIRENADGIDINRTFNAARPASVEAELITSVCAEQSYSLVVDLHEDAEADGFYCYEAIRDARVKRIGNTVLNRIHRSGFGLQQLTTDFDLGFSPDYLLAACRLGPGIVSLHHEAYGDEYASGKMLTTHFLREGRTRRAITIETPRSRSWTARLAMHAIAVLGAIECI